MSQHCFQTNSFTVKHDFAGMDLHAVLRIFPEITQKYGQKYSLADAVEMNWEREDAIIYQAVTDIMDILISRGTLESGRSEFTGSKALFYGNWGAFFTEKDFAAAFRLAGSSNFRSVR